jgi:hypothetical protein
MPFSETPANQPSWDPSQPTDATANAEPAPYLDQQLDGNAAGGVLGAIFPFEMTTAVATCAGCGATNPIGAVMAYMHGMGTVLRCPGCGTALIRVAHIQDRYYLDLRGVGVLQLSAAVPSA